MCPAKPDQVVRKGYVGIVKLAITSDFHGRDLSHDMVHLIV